MQINILIDFKQECPEIYRKRPDIRFKCFILHISIKTPGLWL